MGQGNRTQRPYMGFNTVGTGKPNPKTIYGIETEPKDHIWDSTQLGQGNQTQRPYMGLKPDSKTIYGIETGPKDHRIQYIGTGKPDPKTIYRILIGKWVALMVAK